MAKREETVSVELYLKTETGAAYLGFQNDDMKDGEEIWLPKSQVELVKTRDSSGGLIATFELPEWLAVKAGLI